MSQILSIPVLLLLLSIQISISSRFSLLNGFADLILVWLAAWIVQSRFKNSWVWFLFAFAITAFVTAVPWYAIFIGYLSVLVLGILIRKRLWQSQVLSFLVVLILGSIASYFTQYFSLELSGITLPWVETMKNIIIPSILLNLIIAFPVYLITWVFSRWINPEEELI